MSSLMIDITSRCLNHIFRKLILHGLIVPISYPFVNFKLLLLVKLIFVQVWILVIIFISLFTIIHIIIDSY